MAKYVGFRQGKVHESHVISEYYCGGCGWPVTDHDSFCPECGGAFRKCDADDENIRRLEAENDKLKKLMRDVYALNWNGFDCTECSWFDECRTEGGCPWLGILHDHMRELGVNEE